MSNPRFICKLTWQIIGNGTHDDIANVKNTCPEHSSVISRPTKMCDNCYNLTHEGSESYNRFNREHPGVVPERLSDPVVVKPVFIHQKYIVTHSYLGNLRKPYVDLLNRIKENPEWIPTSKKQCDMALELIDSLYLTPANRMVDASKLTKEITIRLIDKHGKRDEWMRKFGTTMTRPIELEDYYTRYPYPKTFQAHLISLNIPVTEADLK